MAAFIAGALAGEALAGVALAPFVGAVCAAIWSYERPDFLLGIALSLAGMVATALVYFAIVLTNADLR